MLDSAVKALNKAVVGDLKMPPGGGRQNDRGGGESELLYEMSSFLQLSGHVDPKTQIYITTNLAPKMAELIFIVILAGLGKVAFSANTGVCVCVCVCVCVSVCVCVCVLEHVH